MTEITNDKLFEVLMGIQREQGRQTGLLESIKDNHSADKLTAQAGSVAIEGRLRAVENRGHWYAGFGAALGAFAGYLGFHVKL